MKKLLGIILILPAILLLLGSFIAGIYIYVNKVLTLAPIIIIGITLILLIIGLIISKKEKEVKNEI